MIILENIMDKFGMSGRARQFSSKFQQSTTNQLHTLNNSLLEDCKIVLYTRNSFLRGARVKENIVLPPHLDRGRHMPSN